MAEAAGTSQSTILRRLRELDVRVRPQGGHWLPAELHGAAFRLYYDEGPIAAETGNALGVSTVTVLRWLHRGGFGPRPSFVRAPATLRRKRPW